MIRNVTFEETTYADAPAQVRGRHAEHRRRRRPGGGAGLCQPARTAEHRHVRALAAANMPPKRLSQINGLRLIGTAREKVGVLSFVLPNRRTEEVGRLLDQEGIAVRAGHHCSQPSLRRFGVERPSDRRSRSITRTARSTGWSTRSSESSICRRNALGTVVCAPRDSADFGRA